MKSQFVYVIFIIIGEGDMMASEKHFGFLALIKDENRNSYLGAKIIQCIDN